MVLLVAPTVLRQAQATGTSLPFLMSLALVGVSMHAWTLCTTKVILRVLGLVMEVAERTERRFDMSPLGCGSVLTSRRRFQAVDFW